MTSQREEEELATALSQILDNYMLAVRTITVATVISYDAATQTARVQPLLKRKLNTDPQAELPPEIGDVMVNTFGNGVWTMTADLQPGTDVVLGICDRSLQSWKVKGGELDPAIPRTHNMTDAIILGVVNAKPKAAELVTPGPGIEIRKNDGTLRLRLDDAVYITSKTGEDPPVDVIKIDASGVTITGSLTVKNVAADKTITMADGATTNVGGDISTDGEVTADGVAVSTHDHDYIDTVNGTPGTKTTEAPN